MRLRKWLDRSERCRRGRAVPFAFFKRHYRRILYHSLLEDDNELIHKDLPPSPGGQSDRGYPCSPFDMGGKASFARTPRGAPTGPSPSLAKMLGLVPGLSNVDSQKLTSWLAPPLSGSEGGRTFGFFQSSSGNGSLRRESSLRREQSEQYLKAPAPPEHLSRGRSMSPASLKRSSSRPGSVRARRSRTVGGFDGQIILGTIKNENENSRRGLLPRSRSRSRHHTEGDGDNSGMRYVEFRGLDDIPAENKIMLPGEHLDRSYI